MSKQQSEQEDQLAVFGGKTLKQNLRDIVARSSTGYSYDELVEQLNDKNDDLLDDDELEELDKTVRILSHLYVFMVKQKVEAQLADQKVKHQADIAQAIGYCQGLGKPNSYLEKCYPDIVELSTAPHTEGGGEQS